ncbi:MAG: tetratricopeptide repeat protein [Bryobacterales bacterium]|nr:tetratricopeptide repeat protein [Acidobacteriota bacterium]MCB9383690.1 tetratricopeptide repeat protein [Bryobacterales bacterium]
MLLLAAAACNREDPSKEPDNLPPIPAIELTRVSDDVRQSIQQAIDRLRQYPGDPLLNGELGMALHANRRYQEAAVLYDRARKIHPTVFRWEYYRGLVLSELNDVDEAAASFKRALEINPDDPNASLALAQLYFKSARMTKNESLEAEGDKTLDRLIETHPDFAYGKLLRAVRLDEEGDSEGAIAIYQQMLESGPGYGMIHQALARLYDEQGDEGLATRHKALARQATQAAPPVQNRWLAALSSRFGLSGMDHATRGQILLQNHMNAPAAAELEKAILDDPDNVGHRVNLVAAYGMMQRFDKAQEHYQAALRMGGGNAQVHLNMGTMYLAAGDMEQAQKAYERALAADGTLIKSHLGLSRIAQRRKDFRRAESYVRQALTLEPLNPNIHWELGRVLLAEGRPAEAVEMLEQGARYSEGRLAVRQLRLIAKIHEQAGDKAEAQNALERARTEAERSHNNVDLALIDAQLAEYKGAAAQ